MDWITAGPTLAASFMASMVEFVEALTIVLAVGLVRGWRSTLFGTAVAGALLLALVAALGPALTRIPLPVVQFVVGILLLLFGLRWLRKAVLRAAGVLALHDEGKAFAEETALLQHQPTDPRRSIDGIAFATAFKTVVLEGIEVVFIVVATGAGGPRQLAASMTGAGLALLTVVALGLWLHRPLTRVPENTLKFGVGVLLSAFGTFWVAEGIGLQWPGEDWALIALATGFLSIGLGLVQICARLKRGAPPRKASPATRPAPQLGALRVIAGEMVSLFVDDGWLAAGIVQWVLAVWLWHARPQPTVELGGVALAGGLGVVLAISAMRRAKA